MDRRSFLTGWAARPQPDHAQTHSIARPASGGLEAYVPTASEPWNATRAGHLLRRTTFLPRPGDIATILTLTPGDAVDLLLETPYNPAPPSIADSITESLGGLTTELRGQIIGRWKSDAAALRNWQAAVMRDAPMTAVEKMTAFWSNHFATEFNVGDDYVVAPLLYRQNRMLRASALGNVRQIVENITLDGAMLVYLGGNLNIVDRPNENYAREMLELHTTGLGQYTESDIHEAARILTGWRVAQYSDDPNPNGNFAAWFEPGAHDVGAKQYMGVSFPARDSSTNTDFLVRRDEIGRLVATIFEQRTHAVALFICRKLYHFFVYSNPSAADQDVISAMADLMIASDFEVKPVLAALFTSAHFYDNANIGAQVKTPAEFEVGLARQMGAVRPYADDMARQGQVLFDPPNVSGWPGWHDWLTTTTYPVRGDVAESAVLGLSDQQVLDFVNAFAGADDARVLLTGIGELLLPRPMSDGRIGALTTRLTGGAPEYEWRRILTSSPTTAARNVRDVLQTIARLPDFQLC